MRTGIPAPARALSAAGLVVLLSAVAGCGGKGEVTGQVTFDGKPLPAGRITFLSDAGSRPAKSAPIKDGSYTVADLPAGPAKISVETFPPAGKPNPRAVPPGMQQSVEKMKQRAAESGGGENLYASPPGKYVKIPPRYADPEQSGLTWSVSRGSQEHNVELTR